MSHARHLARGVQSRRRRDSVMPERIAPEIVVKFVSQVRHEFALRRGLRRNDLDVRGGSQASPQCRDSAQPIARLTDQRS